MIYTKLPFPIDKGIIDENRFTAVKYVSKNSYLKVLFLSVDYDKMKQMKRGSK